VSVGFRAVAPADLPRIRDWLQREHVARWWDESTLDELDPKEHSVILLDGRPVGMIQTYIVADYPEWDALVRVGPGVAGVDLFIGEEDLVGVGLGPRVLASFVEEVVFASPETHACVAGIELDNERSLRAFEKAGFVPVRDYEEEGRPHRLVRLDRSR
jgi:aminoglycoside 6'-N-acetyltransferase